MALPPVETALRGIARQAPGIPRYLQQAYWWAYVHPNAVRFFDRGWMVDLILFGNYQRLSEAALDALGAQMQGRTLQVACVYGTLTPRLRDRLAPDASLDVVDVLPIQLRNLAAKLPPDPRVTLQCANAASLPAADASYEQVLLFFLLHEQPERVRRATLAEAWRVLKPGGRMVLVDYHRPAMLNPVRPLVRAVFRGLEPYAHELWEHGIEEFLPAEAREQVVARRTWFGGLYQQLVLVRPANQ